MKLSCIYKLTILYYAIRVASRHEFREVVLAEHRAGSPKNMSRIHVNHCIMPAHAGPRYQVVRPSYRTELEWTYL